MSAEVVAPAVLNYVSHGHFPSSSSGDGDDVSETIITAPLVEPATLSTLLVSLRAAQNAAKDDLRRLSRSAAPDVDVWITRAQALQADILRSRDTARTIVAEAEAAKTLKAEAQDQERKSQLLESELRFNEGLTVTLERVGLLDSLLISAKDSMVGGRLEDAMKDLDDASAEVDVLNQGTVTRLLNERIGKLVDELKEAVTAAWRRGLKVEVENRRLRISNENCGDPAAMPKSISLQEVVSVAQKLKVFQSLAENSGKAILKAIIQPRLVVGKNDAVSRIVLRGDELLCEGETDDSGYKLLFDDLRSMVDFISDRLPPTVSKSLSETLIPELVVRVEEEWLTPAIPLDVEDMSNFQEVFDDAIDLAERIEGAGWHGSHTLREWVQTIPRTWITKKREQILGDVRNLVFTGLRETKTVERVETQMVSKDDALAAGGEGGDDEWDTAWDEPEEQINTTVPPTLEKSSEGAGDDDDVGAWEVDDSEEKKGQEIVEGGEEDAWGWGDGEDTVLEPGNPEVVKDSATKAKSQNLDDPQIEREVTFREQYSITGVPDGLITLVQQVITDAQMLAETEYATLPIAPAATALYTLPTLALAIYRATAPTAYAKLGNSNMLIYNDASRLSDQLRSWQASQPPASRLRLDNDVSALDKFAKRAYSAEMESQRTILRDLLDGAQGFSNCTTAPFKAECEAAVEQTTDRLRDVYKQWTGVLPQSALLQSVGSLLATVTGKMITDVEDLPAISEADSKELKILCEKASSIKDLFQQQGPDGNANDMTFIYCPNWLKFQYLAEIMESSLADIKYLWKEGELSLEFEAEEVIGLIEALFAESQLRRQAITEVRRSSTIR